MILLFLLNFLGNFIYQFLLILIINNPQDTKFFIEKIDRKYGNYLQNIIITGLFLLYTGSQLKKLFKNKKFNSYFNSLIFNSGIILSLYALLRFINIIFFSDFIDEVVEKEIEFRRPTCANSIPDPLQKEKNSQAIQLSLINKIIYYIQNTLIVLFICNGLGFVIDKIIYPKISIIVPKNIYFNPLKNEQKFEPNLLKLITNLNNLHFDTSKGPDIVESDIIEY